MTKKNLPLVSIVIPCYNGERYVKETIKSVLNQTYKNIEIIVVDDGSKDDSIKILNELSSNKKITIITFKRNRGVSQARNQALRKCKGNLICILDADDLFEKKKIEKQVEVFQKDSSLGLVHTFYDCIDQKGKYIKKGVRIKSVSLLQDNFVCASSVMIKKKVFETIGGFDETVVGNYDWDYWLRASEKFKLYFIDEILVHYRIHPKNCSQNRSKDLIYFDLTIKLELLKNTFARRGKPFHVLYKILRVYLEIFLYKSVFKYIPFTKVILRKAYHFTNKIEQKALKIK